MMIPDQMFALALKHDGYSGDFAGPSIQSASDWLDGAEMPVPTPQAGEVLLKLRAASVNPSDLHFIKGEYGQPRAQGRPAGFEGCGDVVATGAGAEALMDQRVAFVASGSGAWAEYCVTRAEMCIPLHPEISDEDGAAQIVNPLTAMAMVDMVGQSDAAFVVSAATSQLGKLMCALGRDLGLSPIALVRRPDAVETLTDLGAAEVLVTTAADFHARLARVVTTVKPRLFLDAVADQISEQVFASMPTGARWVVYGKLGDQAPQLTQIGQLIFMGKQIEGFWLTKWMMSTPPKEQKRVISEVQARFADGRWQTDIAARIPLRQAIPDLAKALNGARGKVMLVPD